MPLNILQCIGKLPTMKNYRTRTSVMLRLRSPVANSCMQVYKGDNCPQRNIVIMGEEGNGEPGELKVLGSFSLRRWRMKRGMTEGDQSL